MQIECQQSLPVVDYDTIAFKEKRLRQDDASAIYGFDRSSAGHPEIKSLVRALHGAIEHALHAKQIGDLRIHRSRERPFPFASVANGLKNLSL